MNKKEVRDLVERAAWTAAQAFIAVILVSNQPFSKQALVAGVAAAISALKNYVKATM